MKTFQRLVMLSLLLTVIVAPDFVHAHAGIMGAAILPSTPKRASYQRCLEWLKTNAGSTDFIISEGDLILEQELDPNKGVYQFELKKGSSTTDRPSEIKLNNTDIFFVTDIAITLSKEDLTVTPKQYTNKQEFTYPEPQFFVGTKSGSASEPEALMTIYRGTMQFQTGAITRTGLISTTNFLYAPQNQMIKQASPEINDSLAQYGPTSAERGYYELTPNLVLDGSQSNSVMLSLGAGDRAIIDGAYNHAGSAAGNLRNVVAVKLKGFIITNGAEKANKVQGYSLQA